MSVGSISLQTTRANTVPEFRIAQTQTKSRETCSAEFNVLMGQFLGFMQEYAAKFARKDESTQRANASQLFQQARNLQVSINKFELECDQHLEPYQRKMLNQNKESLNRRVGELSKKLPMQLNLPEWNGPKIPPVFWPQMPDLDFFKTPI